MTESRVDGAGLQLVAVCLTDDGAGELGDELGWPLAPAPAVVWYLRPSEARGLAFCLWELAERRKEAEDERV